MRNLSRQKGRHKKRDVSVAVYELNGAEIAKAIADGAVITDAFQLAMLPKNILITASTTTVLVPFDAGVVNVGMVGGTGTEFAAGADLTAAADTVVGGSGDISIQTGPEVVASYTGTPSTGRAVVIVEYIEYEQCTGELTNFVD